MSYGWCYDRTGEKCSKGPQSGAVVLMDWCLQKWPGLSNMGIYNCRQVAGGNRLSTHGEGRGLDLGVPRLHDTVGSEAANWLVAHAYDLGIQRVIWNRWAWDARGKRWEPYEGENPHYDHVHAELCWAAARTLTAEIISASAQPTPQEADVNAEQDTRLRRIEKDVAELRDFTLATLAEMNEREKRQGLDLGAIKSKLGV